MFMIVETVQMGATLSWETERSQHFRTFSLSSTETGAPILIFGDKVLL